MNLAAYGVQPVAIVDTIGTDHRNDFYRSRLYPLLIGGSRCLEEIHFIEVEAIRKIPIFQTKAGNFQLGIDAKYFHKRKTMPIFDEQVVCKHGFAPITFITDDEPKNDTPSGRTYVAQATCSRSLPTARKRNDKTQSVAKVWQRTCERTNIVCFSCRITLFCIRKKW